MIAAFERAYRQQFSFLMPDKTIVWRPCRSRQCCPGEHERSPGDTPGPPMARNPRGSAASGGEVSRGRTLPPGTAGGRAPAVSMYVDGRWAGRAARPATGPAARSGRRRPGADRRGLRDHGGGTGLARRGHAGSADLLLTRVAPRPGRSEAGTAADPVLLEIFNNLFMSVAEQMGARLRATAHSVNIKERLDFSCAVFDAGGGLIANAPHMPVHLGSMGESHRDGRRAQRRHDAAGRRVHAERPLPRRHPPARRHRGHPGVRRGGRPPAVLRRVAGAPRRDRRDHARVDARVQHRGGRGRGGDRQLAAGTGRDAARGGDTATCWPARPTRRATPR